MIERDFVKQKTKEYYIHRYIQNKLKRVGISSIKLKKIPLGEKIIIQASRPSLIVGSKGSTIRELTRALKKQFKLENPQIEISEVKTIYLDANIVAEQIASFLERFGSARFKSIGHKTMSNVLNAGALGVEIIISGKIPGARAKSWRFYQGYLKKCGDISVSGVRKAHTAALLKSGIIGIKVAIMPPNLTLPDNIEITKELQQSESVTEIKEEESQVEEDKKTSSKKETKKPAKKKSAKKTTKKKSAKKTVKKEDSKAGDKSVKETNKEDKKENTGESS